MKKFFNVALVAVSMVLSLVLAGCNSNDPVFGDEFGQNAFNIQFVNLTTSGFAYVLTPADYEMHYACELFAPDMLLNAKGHRVSVQQALATLCKEVEGGYTYADFQSESFHGDQTGVCSSLDFDTEYVLCVFEIKQNNTPKVLAYKSVRTLPVEGAIKGVFSVGDNEYVYFSKGNLQYKYYYNPAGKVMGADFCFAEHQYDVLGKEINERCITEDRPEMTGLDTLKMDLFGWGTGNNPRKNSDKTADYKTFNEWGAKNIINGGGANKWRTLTKDNWAYLFCYRQSADRLFATGTVNGVNGVILLPDKWNDPKANGKAFASLAEQGYSKSDVRYYSLLLPLEAGMDNTYTASQWEKMEANGAVFLPVAGSRLWGDYEDDEAWYWSSTPHESIDEIALGFCYDLKSIIAPHSHLRASGGSVRLVQNAWE